MSLTTPKAAITVATTFQDIIDAANADPEIQQMAEAAFGKWAHTAVGAAIGPMIAWAIAHNYLPPLPAWAMETICGAGALAGYAVAAWLRPRIAALLKFMNRTGAET